MTKRLLEAPSDTHYMNQLDAEEFIASMDPDAIANKDIVDEDDMWVYVEAGQAYGEANLKKEPVGPQYDCDTCKDEGGEIWTDGRWHTCPDCGDYDELNRQREEAAREAFRKASEEFASHYDNWSEETGWGTEDEDNVDGDASMYEPQTVAYDCADNFFYDNPEWSEWAKYLDMDKSLMKDIIADMVHDAMVRSKK